MKKKKKKNWWRLIPTISEIEPIYHQKLVHNGIGNYKLQWTLFYIKTCSMKKIPKAAM